MRNSSLVVVARRRQWSGAKRPTETAARAAQGAAAGRGASAGGGSGAARVRGRLRSANAGMSSAKGRENRPRRKPQGSGGRIVRSGLGGPKGSPSWGTRWRHGGDSVPARRRGTARDIETGGKRPVGRGRPARGTETQYGSRPSSGSRKAGPGAVGRPYSNRHRSARRRASGARETSR